MPNYTRFFKHSPRTSLPQHQNQHSPTNLPPNITECTRAELAHIKNTIRYCEVLALRLGVQDPIV